MNGIFISAAVFLGVSGAVLLLQQVLFPPPSSVIKRLEHLQGRRPAREESTRGEPLEKPFAERIFFPASRRLIGILGSAAPWQLKKGAENLLVVSGMYGKVKVNLLLGLCALWALLLLCGSLLMFLLGGEPVGRGIFLALAVSGFGLLVPYLILHRKASSRQQAIRKGLPDALDLLLVSVEAGLGLDMALKRVNEKMSGDLAEEFRRALNEIQMGRPRSEALRAVSRRTNVDDLNTVINSIIQSEQLGTGIGNTLRTQAGSLRQKRRQRIEEAAFKAPVKMLFPLVFFIFPAIFVVLLGPALLQMLDVFQTF